MGQSKSKLGPITSNQHASTEDVSTVEEITTPAPPRHITRLSELIDYNDLFEAESADPDSSDSPDSPISPTSPTTPISPNSVNSYTLPGSPTSISRLTTRPSKSVLVQSPSGQILSAQEYLQRPDRQLTLEERKMSIRLNTELGIQKHESNGENNKKRRQKKAGRWGFGFCGL